MRTRPITGVFATEKYLPEPRLGGALMRLRGDSADFSRVLNNAAPYLLNHDKGMVVGKVVRAWYEPNEGFRMVADLPVDDAEPIDRVIQYFREYDQGIRGLFSPGYLVTEIEHAGRAASGVAMFDAAWMLTEVSDMSVPADIDARADAVRALMSIDDIPEPEGLLSLRGLGQGTISPEVLAAVAGAREFNIQHPLTEALRALRSNL